MKTIHLLTPDLNVQPKAMSCDDILNDLRCSIDDLDDNKSDDLNVVTDDDNKMDLTLTAGFSSSKRSFDHNNMDLTLTGDFSSSKRSFDNNNKMDLSLTGGASSSMRNFDPHLDLYQWTMSFDEFLS